MVAARTADTRTPPAQAMPYGFIAGYAQQVLEQVACCKMAPKAKDLLLLIVKDGLSHAGREREHPDEAGLWVNMETERWAVALDCKKQAIAPLRDQLIALGILSQHPAPPFNPADPRTFVSCRLRITPRFTQWKPLDPEWRAAYRQRRFVRARAGSPTGSTRASERNDLALVPADERNELADEQAGVKKWMAASQPPQRESGAEQDQRGASANKAAPDLARTSTVTSLRSPAEPAARSLRLVARTGSQIVTHACREGSAEVVSEAPVRKRTEEVITEEITKAHVAREADTVPVFVWPPRRAQEKSDLDYYQRVLQEQDKARIALLTRLAHEHIGSPPDAYSRIGALAKKCGAALLAKYILQAAASHIDGDDPLSYLTRIVHRQEGSYGQPGTSRTRRETYQPGTGGVAAAHPSAGSDPAGDAWAGWDHKVVHV